MRPETRAPVGRRHDEPLAQKLARDAQRVRARVEVALDESLETRLQIWDFARLCFLLELLAELFELPAHLGHLAAQALDLGFEPRDALATRPRASTRGAAGDWLTLLALILDDGLAREQVRVARLLAPGLSREL